MKSKKHIINLVLGMSFATALFVVGCSSTENAAVAKSGAELWGENLSVDTVAKGAETIAYELLCNAGNLCERMGN